MKKLFSVLGAVAFIAVAAGVNARMNTSNESVSPLTLENIQALASGETSEEYYNATGCSGSWNNNDYCSSSVCKWKAATGSCHK